MFVAGESVAAVAFLVAELVRQVAAARVSRVAARELVADAVAAALATVAAFVALRAELLATFAFFACKPTAALRAGGVARGVDLVLAAAALLLFLIMSARDAIPRSFVYDLAFFGALGIYKAEAAPFQTALAAGALRARWWPPALIILCGSLLLLGVEALW